MLELESTLRYFHVFLPLDYKKNTPLIQNF